MDLGMIQFFLDRFVPIQRHEAAQTDLSHIWAAAYNDGYEDAEDVN